MNKLLLLLLLSLILAFGYWLFLKPKEPEVIHSIDVAVCMTDDKLSVYEETLARFDEDYKDTKERPIPNYLYFPAQHPICIERAKKSDIIWDYDPETITIEYPVLISRCGEIAVDITQSDSYSGGIEIPIYMDLEPDDPICIKAKNHVFEALGGWRHKDRILPYESFVTEWGSGDNFDEFYKYDIGDDFRESPGKYFGKEIPSLEGKVSSWDSNVMVYISVPLDTIDFDKKNESTGQDYLRHLHTEKIRLKNYGVHFKTSEPYPLETYYTKIGEIDQDTCHKLAPNIKGTCAESHIVYLQKYGGGSMGPTTSIGIFGLFQLDNGKEYMVPLKYLTEKAAMKYTGL